MSDSDRPRTIYAAHRSSQREHILHVAEQLFIQQGIDRVSIADIAGAARISRVTLYEYFPNKEELAWAVFQKVMEDLASGGGELRFAPGVSGFDRLARVLEQSLEQLETQREHERFIALFNFLYAREGKAARMRETIEAARPGSYAVFAGLLREGIADGSIRADLDPERVSASLNNLLAGVSHRFALLGEAVQGEYGYPAMELYREIARLILEGIRVH